MACDATTRMVYIEYIVNAYIPTPAYMYGRYEMRQQKRRILYKGKIQSNYGPRAAAVLAAADREYRLLFGTSNYNPALSNVKAIAPAPESDQSDSMNAEFYAPNYALGNGRMVIAPPATVREARGDVPAPLQPDAIPVLVLDGPHSFTPDAWQGEAARLDASEFVKCRMFETHAWERESEYAALLQKQGEYIAGLGWLTTQAIRVAEAEYNHDFEQVAQSN